MSTPHYDLVILGAGGVGSAAAYHGARTGLKTLLLEQFEFDHQHGSSHGQSRIIRYAYDHPVYVVMAKRAYKAWEKIEAEIDQRLYEQTGGIDFGPATDTSMQDFEASLRAESIDFELLQAAEAEKRFPQFRFAEDWQVIYQADAGILRASACVRAHLELARRHGAELRDRTPVIGLTPHVSGVTLQTQDGPIHADRLIVSPGGWGQTVFGWLGLDLPVVPVKTHEVYFDVEPRTDYDISAFPIFIAHLADRFPFWPYGLPSVDGSGLKVGLHGGPPIPNMDTLDRTPSTDAIATVRDFMRACIPAGADAPLKSARVCLYTMTPDEHFILDRHPVYPHIAIAACCSGHAFKFTTVLGEILVDLVRDGHTQSNIDLFSLSRFAGSTVR